MFSTSAAHEIKTFCRCLEVFLKAKNVASSWTASRVLKQPESYCKWENFCTKSGVFKWRTRLKSRTCWGRRKLTHLVEVDLRLGVRNRDGRRRVAADRWGTQPGKGPLEHGTEHGDNGRTVRGRRRNREEDRRQAYMRPPAACAFKRKPEVRRPLFRHDDIIPQIQEREPLSNK